MIGELKHTIDLSTKLNLDLLKYCDHLNSLNKIIISNQLLQSGLEIGRLFSEARTTQSNLGFTHKLNTISSTLDTMQYALKLCQNSEGYPDSSHISEQILRLKHEISILDISLT